MRIHYDRRKISHCIKKTEKKQLSKDEKQKDYISLISCNRHLYL